MPNRSIVSSVNNLNPHFTTPLIRQRRNDKQPNRHFPYIMTTCRVFNSVLFIAVLFRVCESYSSFHLSSFISHKSPTFGACRPTLPLSTRSLQLNVPVYRSIPDTHSDSDHDQRLAALKSSVKLSVSAIRTTLRGLTGISVTSSMKAIVGLFPTWVSTLSININAAPY